MPNNWKKTKRLRSPPRTVFIEKNGNKYLFIYLFLIMYKFKI